jgi:hypothetical protein
MGSTFLASEDQKEISVMSMNRVFAVGLLAAVIAVGSATPASADIVLSAPTVTGSAGNFLWTYTGTVSALEIVNSTGASPAGQTTTTGSGSSSAFKDYFTIYDIAGYIAGSAAASNPDFTAGAQLTGPTPSNVVPNDSAALTNVFFFYTGAAPLVGQAAMGTFSFRSTLGNNGFVGEYVGSDTNNGTNAGATDNKITSLPLPSAAVPEPGSMVLLGSGLIALARSVRQRRSKTPKSASIS